MSVTAQAGPLTPVLRVAEAGVGPQVSRELAANQSAYHGGMKETGCWHPEADTGVSGMVEPFEGLILQGWVRH